MRSFIVMVQRARCGHSSDWLVVRSLGVSIINLLVPISLGCASLRAAYSNFFHSVWGVGGGFSNCKTVQRYCYMYPLRGYQEPSPRLYYCFVTASLLSLHPLLFLISNCLNLPFETQGRSWRLNESISYKQETERGHRKPFVSRSPIGSTWFWKYSTLSSSVQDLCDPAPAYFSNFKSLF